VGRASQKSLLEPRLVDGVVRLSFTTIGAPTQGRDTSIH
jgi:hypothetical protein